MEEKTTNINNQISENNTSLEGIKLYQSIKDKKEEKLEKETIPNI